MRFKIAFTGAGGTGKTTTAVDIYKWLLDDKSSEDVILLKSASRSVYEAEGLTENKVHRMTNRQKWALQDRIFSKKIELDDLTPSFIADRTLLDHWAYCLMYCSMIMKPEEFRSHEAMVRKHMKSTYTHIFYFPWGHWTPPSDGVRQDNPAWQNTIDAIILGYLKRWDLNFCAVPQDGGNINQYVRSQFVQAKVGR